ncbi:MAG TPA: hypothetical protein PK801_16340 [Aggregatilineales bacterium]|nr:hypothetical protein [Chloroflexota bacterium]HOA23335.1 hypothetical protein [Aggregatilineales bacterium]HPV06056.1 hypothetical protein [Aggregatilineales bacterium]HQA69896.1 hypothetical protein [Aggregatilineales bacterium]HQE17783.1 hypothetical protein [Aggregatilineales bacterium]
MSHTGQKPKRKRLPVICDRCGSKAVVALRSAERVLIRCEVCEARILTYYVDRRRVPGEPPPEAEDEFFTRQVERELLRQVSPAAGALYVYLRRYVKKHGYAPTLREMQVEFEWSSPNAATHHLKHLEEVGLIERDYGEPRGIRLPHAA